MAYKLPDPLDPTPLLQEALRQRLALYQQPTQTQVLAPAISQGLQSIMGGVQQGMQRRSVLQAQQDAAEFMKLTPDQRRDPANGDTVARGTRGLLSLGITPPQQQPSIADEIAKAGAIESAKDVAKHKANEVPINPVIAKMYKEAGYPEPTGSVNRDEYMKVSQEAIAKRGEAHKTAQEGAKQSKDDEKFWQKEFNNFAPTNAKRGSLVGQAAFGNARADRALIELNKDPNKITPQLKNLITIDLAGIMQQGSPHEQAIRASGYDTLADEFATLKTKITGNLAQAEIPGIIAELKRVIGSIKEVDNKVIKDNLDIFEAANSERIERNPAKWQKIRERVLGTTATPGEGAGAVITKKLRDGTMVRVRQQPDGSFVEVH